MLHRFSTWKYRRQPERNCIDCLHNGDADSSSFDEKIVGEKVTNAKKDFNCYHTQDTSAYPSVVASSSSCANSLHNKANLNANNEEEGGP